MMDVVRCKFGSIVQETAERLLPEWCSAEKCPARSSYECYYALLHIGINPMRPEDIRKEGQS